MQDGDDNMDVGCFAIKSRNTICFVNNIVDGDYRWPVAIMNKKFNFNIITWIIKK